MHYASMTVSLCLVMTSHGCLIPIEQMSKLRFREITAPPNISKAGKLLQVLQAA